MASVCGSPDIADWWAQRWSRHLDREPIGELITATSAQLDLRRQSDTEAFVADRRPQIVVLAAARVGGINANRMAQAAFLYDNLIIAANVIEATHRHGVKKIVVLGSSCIYPREAPQPISEDALLTGPWSQRTKATRSPRSPPWR